MLTFSRLQANFHAADDDDECQDWFVNDLPQKISDHGNQTQECVNAESSVARKSSTVTETRVVEEAASNSRLGFLHLQLAESGVLIMELCNSEEPFVKKYGSKYFKIYLPQISDGQRDFCLYCRHRVNKTKFRFSVFENKISKWNNAGYTGKLAISTSTKKQYKMVCPRQKQRTVFYIEQDDRKHQLKVDFNPQNPLVNLLRGKPPSQSKECSSIIQKFLNPIIDIHCPSTNTLWLRMDKEGDSSSSKYFIYYNKPFSMFLSACIAVAVQSHLLE
ncbi:hypothetical protein THRCLA_01874 [Thraustotheca clavata]|uniref:Tubby C-terminal domain-containing protein n=1 Tax=Thraustotheca clavata TaxID=74557 RepID=A0A1W0A712_9STRA|nr:hypothetical protein THRCLA_01874 [Thraustotheca clavata]